LNFLPDSDPAISFFKTAGFNRSPTPPALILAYFFSLKRWLSGPGNVTSEVLKRHFEEV